MQKARRVESSDGITRTYSAVVATCPADKKYHKVTTHLQDSAESG